MNDAEPNPSAEEPSPSAIISITGIVTYVALVFVAAVVLTRFVAPRTVLICLALFYVACLCYRRFRPTDTASQAARIANAAQRYVSRAITAGKAASVAGGFKRLGRFLVVPQRSGGLGSLGLLVLCLGFLLVCSTFGRTGSRLAAPTRPIQEIIAGELQTALTQNKQKIFDGIHPVGTAKSATLHDVTITAWKHGEATNRFEDVQQFTVRYTIYWTSPLHSDGYTKITQTYDNETKRYVNGQILTTNGTTNGDVGEALGYVAGAILYEAINGN